MVPSDGITKARENALTEFAKDSNSLFNSKSETALTLFILGNIDEWKQIKTLKILPRNPGWNKAFFDAIRGMPEDIYNASTDYGLWSRLRGEILN